MRKVTELKAVPLHNKYNMIQSDFLIPFLSQYQLQYVGKMPILTFLSHNSAGLQAELDQTAFFSPPLFKLPFTLALLCKIRGIVHCSNGCAYLQGQSSLFPWDTVRVISSTAEKRNPKARKGAVREWHFQLYSQLIFICFCLKQFAKT